MANKYKIVTTTSGTYVLYSLETSSMGPLKNHEVYETPSARIITSAGETNYDDFLRELNRKMWGHQDDLESPTRGEDDSVQLTAP